MAINELRNVIKRFINTSSMVNTEESVEQGMKIEESSIIVYRLINGPRLFRRESGLEILK